MSDEHSSFIMYNESWGGIQLLSREQRGDLLTALMAFNGAADCEMPEMDQATACVFAMLRPRLEANKQKYQEALEKRKEGGKLGGRPAKPQGSEKKLKVSEKTSRFSAKPQGSEKNADPSHGNPAWKEFCYVFSLWPVQQGKEKAWREYAYLRARHLVPESYALADIIERFKAEDRRWKRGYVPMMNNWLHDRRWDDVPEKAPAKSYAPDENGRTPYVNENDQDYSRSYSADIFNAAEENEYA